MDDPNYEPLFDSKWAIPFVVALLLVMMMAMMLLKMGMFAAERRARRSAGLLATHPALPDLPIPLSQPNGV